MRRATIGSQENSPELPAYAIRFSVQVRQDLIDATLYLADVTGDVLRAESWRDGLLQEVRTLATLPHRFPFAEREAKRFRRSTRRMIYRQAGASFAYLIYYTIQEADQEGPYVSIVHIRHGSRKPLTGSEATAIIQNQ